MGTCGRKEGKSYTPAMGAPGMGGGRLLALPLAWLAGVALQLQERELLPRAAYAAIVAAATGALLLSLAMRARSGAVLAVLGALGAGFAITGWQASSRLVESLPGEL